MKSNSYEFALPNTAYTAGGGTIAAPAKGSVTASMDVSMAPSVVVGLVGVTASGGATYAADLSLDNGETWNDVTTSFTAMGAGVTPFTTDGVSGTGNALFGGLPGLFRLRCTAAGSTPPTIFKGNVAFQDSRQE